MFSPLNQDEETSYELVSYGHLGLVKIRGLILRVRVYVSMSRPINKTKK